MTAPVGVAIVDKEAGWTSHDVVGRARKVLDIRKVGHAGTLDPDATGVLVLGVGRATRLLRFLTALPKTYTTTVVFGVETDTLDASGEVTARHDMSGLTAESVAVAAEAFVGEIEQIPPMVSAIKVDGRRLHELAREGIEVERQARPVTIHQLVTSAFDPAGLTVDLEVECSSGTYIRTLAADLGAALGGGAHLRDLCRTRIGSFGLDEARPVDDLHVLAPVEGLRDMPAIEVDSDVAAMVAHGKVLADDLVVAADRGPWRVIGPDGHLLAVYERHRNDTLKPAVVLTG